MQRIKLFLVVLVLFVVLDFLWLGFVVKDFNLLQLAQIGRIENGDFQLNYSAAAIAYILMALAVQFYVLPQVKMHDRLAKVFLIGALLGLIVYGVFDMTNLAILRNYPIEFVVADMAWGTVVFGLVSVITFKVAYK